MSVLKSLFNGIGSGAGVAWPLFGISFSLLGGAIGGVLSVALGAISISLFFAVSIPIVYFSYEEMENNENLFRKQLEKNKQKLALDIVNYIQSIYKNYLIQKLDIDFNNYFEEIVIKDLNEIAKKDKNSPLYQILYLLHKQKNNLINHEVLFEQVSLAKPSKPLPWYQISISSFFAFVGTFGSIAGCSAGVSGLLTGMGILSSLAAFPIVGWSIIGAAVVVGIISAVSAAHSVQEQFKNNELNLMIKKMHQQLNNANFKRDLDVTFHEVMAKDVTQEKAQDLIKVNNPVTSFKKKYSNSNQSAVNFVSFFQAQSADRFEEKDSCPTEKSIDSDSDRSSRYLSTQIELQSKKSF